MHDHDHDHDHDHHHDHNHDHDHAHDHAPNHDHHNHGVVHHHTTVANLKLALALNLGFSVIEIAGGLWTGSVAVLSNAIHDLGDALAIGIAFVMEHLGSRRANSRFSYGYRRLSLVSALATCVFLVTASALVIARAIPLLAHPVQPRLDGMVAFALVGIAVNGFAAWRLSRGGTMNERVVSWHMIEDVLGWATVLIGTIIMAVFDWPIIDPVLCLLSSAFILWGVLRNLRKTLSLFLQATPDGVDLGALRKEIETIGGVASTHDAHLWSLDGRSHVLTLHVVVNGEPNLGELENLKGKIRGVVAKKGHIHVTVEMESAAGACAIDCAP